MISVYCQYIIDCACPHLCGHVAAAFEQERNPVIYIYI